MEGPPDGQMEVEMDIFQYRWRSSHTIQMEVKRWMY
jgi:hypothetical protein